MYFTSPGRLLLVFNPLRFRERSIKTIIPPTNFGDDIEIPLESRKLPTLARMPPPFFTQLGSVRDGGEKLPRKTVDSRGPELVHCHLTYKQFGLQAVRGGNLEHKHIEAIRDTTNRLLEIKRMFAIWRIEAPWKPVTQKPSGYRRGGGKGPVDRYVTPVRAGRIIIELGGKLEWEEAEALLSYVSNRAPMPTRFVSQEMLALEGSIERHLEQNNINPLSMDLALRHNLAYARRYASPYDLFWKGEHR